MKVQKITIGGVGLGYADHLTTEHDSGDFHTILYEKFCWESGWRLGDKEVKLKITAERIEDED